MLWTFCTDLHGLIVSLLHTAAMLVFIMVVQLDDTKLE